CFRHWWEHHAPSSAPRCNIIEAISAPMELIHLSALSSRYLANASAAKTHAGCGGSTSVSILTRCVTLTLSPSGVVNVNLNSDLPSSTRCVLLILLTPPSPCHAARYPGAPSRVPLLCPLSAPAQTAYSHNPAAASLFPSRP